MDEFWPRYGTSKILRFSREWLGLFWLVLDHRKTHQQQIAERRPVAFLNCLASIDSTDRSEQISIYVTAGAGRHSSKAGFTVLSILPYCPHEKILRIFKDELRIDYDLDEVQSVFAVLLGFLDS